MNNIDIFNSDKIFGYSLVSEQVLGMLYNIDEHKNISQVNSILMGKAKNLIETIANGALIQKGVDLNSISSTDNLFMYDYGSSAIHTINNASAEQDISDYLDDLSTSIADIENGKFEATQKLENFFETIARLLDKDLDNMKYMNTNETFGLAI